MTTYLGSLNAAHHALMESDPRVILIGEDLLDPYGGAFKVSKGLSTRFPDRVFSTPISEPGFTGIAAGAAMGGLLPIVEIMFGDFVLLAMDQIVNHATKFAWMYDGRTSVPMVVRAPMGGRRGYGPTHSQTLEKHFLGVPGLRIVAPSVLHDPGALLKEAVLRDPVPVLFIENKTAYPRTLVAEQMTASATWHVGTSDVQYPTVTACLEPLGAADVTLVTYGGMAEMALEAAEQLLIDDELVVEVVVPSCLQPADLAPVLASLRHSGRLLLVEEGTRGGGWGADLLRALMPEGFDMLRRAPVHVAAQEVPIGNSPTLESATLPQLADIIAAARRLAAEQEGPRRHQMRPAW